MRDHTHISKADLTARRGLERAGERQGIRAETSRVYTEGKYKREGKTVREWKKQLNTILLQAPVEAVFKCASVLSGCRIT